MIITFDSGILVQAAERSQGSARRALDLVLDNPSHTLAISPYILGEVGKVLAYPRIQARLEISGERIHA